MDAANLGYVAPEEPLGLGSFFIRPLRGFFPNTGSNAPTDSSITEPISAQATISEDHDDDLEVTTHPIEIGAAIADHAFKRPAVVTLRLGWSNSLPIPYINTLGQIPGSAFLGTDQGQILDVYAKLLNLQANRTPFDLWTGKRHYKTMVLSSLQVNTDKRTENILSVTAVCREVIIVGTQSVTVPGSSPNQASPQKTGAVQDLGQKSTGAATAYPFTPVPSVTGTPI